MTPITEVNRLARALGGVPILGCIPSSPSARAGLRYGDILLEANGIKTESLDDYLEARARDSRRMVGVYFRDGVEHRFELDLTKGGVTRAEVREFVEKDQIFTMMSVGGADVGDPSDSC